MKLKEKHEGRGLVLIGVHCQNVPKDQVLGLCRAHKVNYTVYGSGKIKGCEFKGIPKAFLINWKGEVCWDGHPASGMDAAIEDALKDAPDWLAGPRKYERVKAEAAKVRARKGMGEAAAELRKKAESGIPEEKEEAAELLARLEAYAEREGKRAEAAEAAGDPLKAQAIRKDLGRDFKGDGIGAKAAAGEQERAKDPSFKKELDAAKGKASIEALADSIDPLRRDENVEKWKSKNAAVLAKILGLFKGLEKNFGDTKVCANVKGRLKELHLE